MLKRKCSSNLFRTPRLLKPILGRGRGGSISLVLFPADSDQVHKLPKNRPIDRIDMNRLRKNKTGSCRSSSPVETESVEEGGEDQ